MTDTIDEFLSASLDDRRLSRAERKTLAALRDELQGRLDPADLRRKAFEVARAALPPEAGPGAALVIDWLEDVLKAVEPADGTEADTPGGIAEVHFSPGDDCRDRISGLLRSASRAVDVCVFTITDDRVSDAILDAHRRGVSVRVITDNEKAGDSGSDIGRLRKAGIPVRVDHSPYHMHNKFAVFDGRIVLTGSYNWTRGAAVDNEENLIVSDDPRLVGPYVRAFDRLWGRLK